MDLPCGGQGRCGKCRVTAQGKLSPLTEEEKRLWRESVSPVYEHTKYKDFLKRIYDAEFQYRKHGSNFSDDFIF